MAAKTVIVAATTKSARSFSFALEYDWWKEEEAAAEDPIFWRSSLTSESTYKLYGRAQLQGPAAGLAGSVTV